MIGRTNATTSGSMKYITGSFTSDKTASQSSFTVSGLDFEPKVIAVYGGTPKEIDGGVGTNVVLISAFSDIENGIGFCTYQASSLVGSYSVSDTPNLTVSKSEDGYTIKASSYLFSNIRDGKGFYSTFKYYIYG